MFSKLSKIFLYTISFYFIALMASFYFLGVIKTTLLLGLAGEFTDRALDKYIGPRKEVAVIDSMKFKMPEEYLVVAKKAKGKYKDNVIFTLEYI